MAESVFSESGHRFALLYQLSQTFSSSLDLAEVLDLVIDEVVKTLQAERGFIALWNENGAREFRSARGFHKTMIEQPEFEISRGVVEEVAKYGKVICISDAQSDDHFRKRPGVLNLSLRSILCAPLKLKDNILGVIYIDNRMIAGRIPATPVQGGQGEGGNSSALGELLCNFPPDKVVNSSCWGGGDFSSKLD